MGFCNDFCFTFKWSNVLLFVCVVFACISICILLYSCLCCICKYFFAQGNCFYLLCCICCVVFVVFIVFVSVVCAYIFMIRETIFICCVVFVVFVVFVSVVCACIFMIRETIFIGSAERPPNTLCQHNTNHETQNYFLKKKKH